MTWKIFKFQMIPSLPPLFEQVRETLNALGHPGILFGETKRESRTRLDKILKKMKKSPKAIEHVYYQRFLSQRRDFQSESKYSTDQNKNQLQDPKSRQLAYSFAILSQYRRKNRLDSQNTYVSSILSSNKQPNKQNTIDIREYIKSVVNSDTVFKIPDLGKKFFLEKQKLHQKPSGLIHTYSMEKSVRSFKRKFSSVAFSPGPVGKSWFSRSLSQSNPVFLLDNSCKNSESKSEIDFSSNNSSLNDSFPGTQADSSSAPYWDSKVHHTLTATTDLDGNVIVYDPFHSDKMLLLQTNGHQDSAKKVAWHPVNAVGFDESWFQSISSNSSKSLIQLISCGFDDSCILWSVSSGQSLGSLQGHENRVTNIKYIDDGGSNRMVVTSSLDCSWRIWDTNTQQSLFTSSSGKDQLYDISPHPDQSLIAIGGTNGRVLLTDLRSFKPIMSLEGHCGSITSLDWSTPSFSHPLLASGSSDCSVKLWDIRMQRALTTLCHHYRTVSQVKFYKPGSFPWLGNHLGGEILVSSGYDETLRFSSMIHSDHRLISTLNITGTPSHLIHQNPDIGSPLVSSRFNIHSKQLNIHRTTLIEGFDISDCGLYLGAVTSDRNLLLYKSIPGSHAAFDGNSSVDSDAPLSSLKMDIREDSANDMTNWLDDL